MSCATDMLVQVDSLPLYDISWILTRPSGQLVFS